jgi:protein TonB
MATMSGAALPPATPGYRPIPEEPRAPELFGGLVVSNPAPTRRGYWVPASLIGHAIAIAAMILVPLFWPGDSPEHPDYIRALLYNPPPPPPPPLPKGSATVETQTARPVTPDPKPDPDRMVSHIPTPKVEELKPEARDPESQQKGVETGSDMGVNEGQETGVEGGQIGGVENGVLGGVVGGTGDIPVTDYDQAPRLIRQTRPEYPQEAFVKKIAGKVEVEILIDTSGRVARARVVSSVPTLNQAAIACVQQWLFAPAMKAGRPVSSIARAVVDFTIF